MSYTTVIACEAATRHIGAPRWVFVDCRSSMADREQGRRDYRQAHVPGAVYAGLDDDLSGPVIPGITGRHPLPDKEQVVATINRLGITNDTQVVVYDDQAGQMAAARLWWLLTWAGHPRWLSWMAGSSAGNPLVCPRKPASTRTRQRSSGRPSMITSLPRQMT